MLMFLEPCDPRLVSLIHTCWMDVSKFGKARFGLSLVDPSTADRLSAMSSIVKLRAVPSGCS